MAWHRTWNEPPPRRRPSFGGGITPPGVRLILIITVAVFFVDGLMNGRLTEIGALSAKNAWLLYPLLTYQFLHAGIAHIFWNMFLLWMLGVTLERQLGTRRFLYLYLISGVVGGLFEVAFNVLMYTKHGAAPLAVPGPTFLTIRAVGASAGVAGVLVAFAVQNPRALFLLFFILPVEARWVALVYVLAETRHIVLGLTHGWTDGVAHAAHFGGMVVGFVWVKWGYRIARAVRNRPGHDRRPFFGGGEGRAKREQVEVDRILKKIHDQGIDSLTQREKLFLQETSRKYRDRF